MILSKQEENKNKIIAGAISATVFGLLLLILLLYVIVTPNPPFASGGGGGLEMALGMMDVGNSNVEYGTMGQVTDVITEPTPVQANNDIITDPNGDVETNIEPKPNTEVKPTVITPTKPVEIIKPKTQAELLAEKFKNHKGQNGGGIGNNENAGQEGAPDGNPNSNGTGGSGGGTGGGHGTGDGPGTGPGRGPGKGGYGFSLAGRNVITPPSLSKDTKEEGKVVVEITVDKNGNVIKADPNGRGTTTNSAILKAKAKQAAMNTKFSPSNDYEEQKGTITIVFSF